MKPNAKEKLERTFKCPVKGGLNPFRGLYLQQEVV